MAFSSPNCTGYKEFSMETAPISFQVTADGSHTLFHAQLNETYHSHHGALTESRHVFMKHGLQKAIEAASATTPAWVSVLEIGFGTGLNALLSVELAQQHPEISFRYETLEPFPLDLHLVERLNYNQYFPEGLNLKFNELHTVAWDREHRVTQNFVFLKRNIRIEDFTSSPSFDVIYFDAFAPSKQAEMWQLPQLQKMYDSLKDGGFLATYCANGQFKRNLKAAGFTVECPPGPPGKREMTIGIKALS